jgi:poly(3-hydroxybutyrate) depolymerase/prenyltransferase beta subunit
MRQTVVSLCALLVLLASQQPAPAQSLSITEREQTAQYAESRQNPDGGFAAEPGAASSLGSTTASIRILRYTGAAIPDVLACIDFVRSCADPETGGFSQTPGGQPDVGSTASGLMSLGELRIADPTLIAPAIAYLSENAKTFPEVRIAVAGMEAVKQGSPSFDEWSATILENRNDDGTWGSGPSLAFKTGGTTAALLRMGIDPDRKDAVIKAIVEGQNDDGGWSSGEGPSDLSASYRVTRAAFMLNSAPDLDALRGFIARCRRDSGGYAPVPEEESSTLGATYMATILLRWADLLEGLPPVPEVAGFQELFNGEDLTGWEGETSLWSARDGMLIGRSPSLDQNEFLASQERFTDFIFKCSFQLVDGRGNSGIQFRSERLPGNEMIGYQADIGEDYWGCLYDESRRNRVLVPASEPSQAAVRQAAWNQYGIRAMGDQIRLTLNGVPSVSYEEDEDEIADTGRIAVQLHSGGPMEVRFRDLLIQPLPRPSSSSNPKESGFHLRTLKGSEPADRYSVFVPEGYDGSKAFPVVLFLHGSGERGSDGILPSQVGLGPIIAANPSEHPYLAVFPQARETWKADSDDGRRALAILDEVIQDYAVDPSRMVLTGISMGGMGTWSIGAAHPDRFSALLPVCGPGDPESVEQLRTIPVWGFVGDDDRDLLLDGMRAMARSLKELGAPARYTEYRGIGHNCWDRAYSEPSLVEWMLTPHRVAE